MVLSCSHVLAEEKEYTINNADFKVQLFENGDARVTETWKLDFTKGNFTRFYVERFLRLPEEEKFSDITYDYFKINGKECSLNNSDKRISFTYSVDTSSKYETYAWYMDAENEEMTFETRYTLKDVFSGTLSTVEVSNTTSIFSGIGKIIKTLLFLLLRLVFYGFFILCIINTLKEKTRYKKLKNLAKDPQRVQAIWNRFVNLYITPMEYNTILGEPFTEMNSFRLILLELIRRVIIFTDFNYLHIDMTKWNYLKDYEQKFIEVLLQTIPFENRDLRRSILLSEFFNEVISKNKDISRLMSDIEQTLKKIPHTKDKALKDEAITLKVYLKNNSTNFPASTFEVFQYYENNRSIDLIALYYIASSTPKTTSTQDLSQVPPIQNNNRYEFYQSIALFLDVAAAKYVTSSSYYSSCASCSSCSSCSSCGGGGAD